MAVLLFTHKVKDFAAWKKAFDSHLSMRKSFGEISAEVYRDSSDPNLITVVNKWDSVASAQKFAHSPELKAAMENSGVVGQPAVSFLNEA